MTSGGSGSEKPKKITYS